MGGTKPMDVQRAPSRRRDVARRTAQPPYREERQVNDDVSTLIKALQLLIAEAGGDKELRNPKGYAHLGLCVVDAVWSVRSNYTTVVEPVVDDYCSGVASLAAEDARFDSNIDEHTTAAVHARLEGLKGPELLKPFGGRRNKSPGTSILKATTVLRLATALEKAGVVGVEDLRREFGNPAVVKAVRAVPGVGTATWRYVCNLSLVEKVKPDEMVKKWFNSTGLGERSANEIAELIEAATAQLKEDGAEVTVRQVDHLIWRKASGRPLT